MAAMTALRRRPARRLDGGALADLRRPGVAELVVLLLAGVALAGIALAGGTRATGGPSAGGLALGVERVASGNGGTTIVTVIVANDTGADVSARLTATGPNGTRRADIDVPVGTSRSVQVSVPAECGTPVALTLDAPGGVQRQASAAASCNAGGAG